MYHKELECLINEYKNASSKEDVFVKLKLESIASYYSKCDRHESIFANEIVAEFCRLIHVLKEQNRQRLQSIEREEVDNIANYRPRNLSTGFVPYRKEQEIRYECDYQLLGAFYNHFKKEHELDYYKIDTYPFESDDDRKKKVNSTLQDYVARIYTFANKYLSELYSREEILSSGSQDDVLFIYDNIEYILAKFNTKDESGKTIKQRLNIRSALRKLNEFKCVEEK